MGYVGTNFSCEVKVQVLTAGQKLSNHASVKYEEIQLGSPSKNTVLTKMSRKPELKLLSSSLE